VRSEDARLGRECQVFAQYLSGADAEPYVLEKYCDAHHRKASLAATSAFDRILIRLALNHRVFTTMVDAYARFFAPGCALRRKLVLLLAILESSAAAERFLVRTDSQSKAVLALAFLGRVVPLAVGLTVAVVALLPLQVVLGAGAEREAR
jgi:hypothetical protein